LLAAIDHRSEIWKFYKVQRIVVDAPDEGGACQQVAKRLALRGSALHPWLDPALTSCEKVDESLGRHRGTKENKEAQSDTGRLKSSLDPRPE
jgi:hypothetical protein